MDQLDRDRNLTATKSLFPDSGFKIFSVSVFSIFQSHMDKYFSEEFLLSFGPEAHRDKVLSE